MNALWLAEAKVFLRLSFLVQARWRAQPDNAQGKNGSNFGQSGLEHDPAGSRIHQLAWSRCHH
jgi:hypothetical protein